MKTDTMKNGIIAIGSTNFLLGFALAGITTVLAKENNLQSILATYHDAGIVILDEAITTGLSNMAREQLDTSISPIIITIGKDNILQQDRLRKNIMSILGIDLLK